MLKTFPAPEKRGDPGRGLTSLIWPHSQSPDWLLFIQKQYTHLIITSKSAASPSLMTMVILKALHVDQALWVVVLLFPFYR